MHLHDRPGLQAALVDAGARVTFVGTRPRRLDWVRALTAITRARQPDLVHTTLFEADLCGRVAARLAGTSVVSSLVNEGYGASHLEDPELRRWKVRAAQVFDAATARLTPRMHAVSEFIADEMAGHLRYPRDRIDVVPRGRDPATLGRRLPERRAAARERLGVAPGRPLLLAVARQEHQKGLDVLLEAMVGVRRAVPDAELVVAGRVGAHSESLQRTVDRLGQGAAVRFLGARTDVGDLLSAADLFVLPSRREGSPGSVMEAMALEAPVVVSDIPMIREVVDESCAVLVPPDAPDRLCEAIVESLRAPEEAAARAEVGYVRFVERFTIGAVAARMIEFYLRCAGPVMTTRAGNDTFAVLQVVTSTDPRGAEVFAMALGQALPPRVRVTTVALAPGASGGLALETLGPRRLGVKTLIALRRRMRLADVVVAHGSTTLPACALAVLGLPQPVVYRNIGDPLQWSSSRLRRLRTRVLLGRMRRVVALTTTTADVLTSRLGVRADRVRVVPNAVDGRRFTPAGPEERRAARVTRSGWLPTRPRCSTSARSVRRRTSTWRSPR